MVTSSQPVPARRSNAASRLRSVRDAHRKLKTSVLRWLVTNRPQNLLTGPLIYGMVVPLPAELLLSGELAVSLAAG